MSLEPVTELSNPRSSDIDQQPLERQLGILASIDGEMFGSGWGLGLMDRDFQRCLDRAKLMVKATLDRAGTVVVCGAGTSGRLAILAARSFGSVGQGKIRGMMAGGAGAFVRPREGIEDQGATGIGDLREIVSTARGPVTVVGVTCGLSAAYVLAQCDWLSTRPEHAAIVIGFNPIESVGDIDVDGRSARDILATLENRSNAIVLNPIIGPEAVTGSSRMKGGSATLMILDVLLNPKPLDLNGYHNGITAFHAQTDALGDVVRSASAALSRGAELSYLASAEFGMVAVTDASECVPTFGADFDDVRAFVAGGWRALGLRGSDEIALSKCPGHRRQPPNCAISIGLESGGLRLPAITPPIPASPLARQLWVKMSLNIISTLAHIAAGKVLGNLMVDVRISNRKLWRRACRLVSQLTGAGEDASDWALSLAAGVEPSVTVDDKVRAAVHVAKLVPTAVLVKAFDLSVGQARARLRAEPKLCDHGLSRDVFNGN